MLKQKYNEHSHNKKNYNLSTRQIRQSSNKQKNKINTESSVPDHGGECSRPEYRNTVKGS
jgi:hypothetical protein